MTKEGQVTQQEPMAEVVVEPEVVEPIKEPEQIKPEVNLEELQKQLTELQKTSQKYEDNWKNESRVKAKKDLEIQRLRERLTSTESQEAMLKALIAVVAQQRGQPEDLLEGEVRQQQPDLVKQYEKIQEESKKKREIDTLNSRAESIRRDVESLGLTPNDDEYEVIRLAVRAGELDKAEIRLNKIREAKQVIPPTEPKPDAEQEFQKRLRAELEKRGLLTQDTGGPSASASKRQDVLAKIARGELSTAEAEKIGFKFS